MSNGIGRPPFAVGPHRSWLASSSSAAGEGRMKPGGSYCGPARAMMMQARQGSGGTVRYAARLPPSRRGPHYMGMAVPIYYTADMVRAFPEDGNRYEVVRGELLVTPAPRPWHEIVQGRLTFALEAYLREQPVGHLFGSRSDISWSPDTLVSPDLFVAPL